MQELFLTELCQHFDFLGCIKFILSSLNFSFSDFLFAVSLFIPNNLPPSYCIRQSWRLSNCDSLLVLCAIGESSKCIGEPTRQCLCTYDTERIGQVLHGEWSGLFRLEVAGAPPWHPVTYGALAHIFKSCFQILTRTRSSSRLHCAGLCASKDSHLQNHHVFFPLV